MKIHFGKTFTVRLVAIVLVILFGVMLFFIGKQHTILLDNKAITVAGKEIPALKLVEVQIDKFPSMEFVPRDRDKVDVTMQKHSVTITYTDASWEEISITRKFQVPLMDEMVIISIPTLVANPDAPQSLWLEKYVVPAYAVQAVPADEVIVTDELAGLISQ
ncbi:DUF6672 family protein [Sphaerochaeta sp. PS]|uniref:DUF6672 family protein n=1 Tax=Sphaerochaeta sp. PS TaxID=3076336 RepID=UPI0028A56AA1|nr:DUF6672 family protein [Sphaerochaeta sp. PS]MDT4760965.1 DUF6672 family protein [Sphaerochaeta sp. PS]